MRLLCCHGYDPKAPVVGGLREYSESLLHVLFKFVAGELNIPRIASKEGHELTPILAPGATAEKWRDGLPKDGSTSKPVLLACRLADFHRSGGVVVFPMF